mmetsp:Transcript_14255/g.33854  ORF Transcript_14255/g.33854 Transcript_14255/m.33854 type:complete len:201 (-) Transcript_14255:12-614(-)
MYLIADWSLNGPKQRRRTSVDRKYITSLTLQKLIYTQTHPGCETRLVILYSLRGGPVCDGCQAREPESASSSLKRSFAFSTLTFSSTTLARNRSSSRLSRSTLRLSFAVSTLPLSSSRQRRASEALSASDAIGLAPSLFTATARRDGASGTTGWFCRARTSLHVLRTRPSSSRACFTAFSLSRLRSPRPKRSSSCRARAI